MRTYREENSNSIFSTEILQTKKPKKQQRHLIILSTLSLRPSVMGWGWGVTLLHGAEAAEAQLRSDLVKHHLDSGSHYCSKLQQCSNRCYF